MAAETAVLEIDPRIARSWLDEGDAILVDVREPDEHARERIPGARLMPLSRFSPGALPAAGRVILHCQGGRRSLEAAQRLAATGRDGVASLAGGLQAWRDAGLPTERDHRVPISVMRQVQIVAGGTVLLGSILAAAVSPWFLILTGFFGGGLLFSGLSGTCGMASALALMPWNRVARQPVKDAP